MRDEMNLEAMLRELEHDLVGLKNKQRLGGDTWSMYRATGSFTAPMTPGVPMTVLVTFTNDVPDGPGEYTIANCTIESSGRDGVGLLSFSALEKPVNGSFNQWQVEALFTGTALTYSANVLVRSSKPGTVSISAI